MTWKVLREIVRTGMAFGACAAMAAEDASMPLTPSQEQASFRLADSSLVIELVVAEPDVVSPVAIAFDAEERMFVAEMLDYPDAQTSGRIRLLEDRDRDGRYESATVFAGNLPFPNGVLPWRDGVLVTAAPDIWYLKDTDGDGQADERRVVLTGFGLGNHQLRVNGLTWGLDNWVYGANGRSDGAVRAPSDSPGKATSIRGFDFRFRPDSGEFQVVAGRSQFGLARDDWGNRFLSWNTIPIRHEVLPVRYLDRNPHLASTESLADLVDPSDPGRVYPLAPPPLTFNNESVKNFNALAGLTVFRGSALGSEYQGNAFVGESLLNLVHRRVLEPEGVTFTARRGASEQEKEFLASTDPWFHPVNFATGPDGALYVVDFYRMFVEHPEWVRGAARDKVSWRTGAEHGRIWRIRNSQAALPDRKRSLSQAGGRELVEFLGHENGWWRDTAQRLLVERQDRSVIPALEEAAQQASSPLGRVHALHTLDALRALTPDRLLAALADPHAGVRVHAVRLSEPWLAREGMDSLRTGILALAGDPDVRVRFQVALTVGEFEGEGKLDALTRIAALDSSERWIIRALLSSAGTRTWPFLRTLAGTHPAWLNQPTPDQARLLEQAARQVGAWHTDQDLQECLAWMTTTDTSLPVSGRLAALAGLSEGLARSPHPLRNLVTDSPGVFSHFTAGLRSLVRLAATQAMSGNEASRDRIYAIRILARATPELAGESLLRLMQPEQAGEIQSAAARAVADLDDTELTRTLFTRWSEFKASLRGEILSHVPRSTAMTAVLADSLEHGSPSVVEIDATVRQSLLKAPNAAVRQRFERLLTTSTNSNRQDRVDQFQSALGMKGDRVRGAALFENRCLLCHMVEGKGRYVGPDLSGIASRPKDALLVDILDPSRQISPDFINYTAITADGEGVTGLIVSETGTSVTLRRAGDADQTLLRSQIKDLRAEVKSLMPEGLEDGLTPQEFADLLSFLEKPEGQLLSTAK